MENNDFTFINMTGSVAVVLANFTFSLMTNERSLNTDNGLWATKTENCMAQDNA